MWYMQNNYLSHFGVLGMRWGVRRYQPYSVTGKRKSGKGGKEIGEAAQAKLRSRFLSKSEKETEKKLEKSIRNMHHSAWRKDIDGYKKAAKEANKYVQELKKEGIEVRNDPNGQTVYLAINGKRAMRGGEIAAKAISSGMLTAINAKALTMAGVPFPVALGASATGIALGNLAGAKLNDFLLKKQQKKNGQDAILEYINNHSSKPMLNSNQAEYQARLSDEIEQIVQFQTQTYNNMIQQQQMFM